MTGFERAGGRARARLVGTALVAGLAALLLLARRDPPRPAVVSPPAPAESPADSGPSLAVPPTFERTSVEASRERSGEPQRLAPEEVAYTGTVIAPDGTPIAGASLRVVPAWEDGPTIATATTDATGRFWIRGVEPLEDRFTIVAEAEGFWDLEKLLDPVGGDVELELSWVVDLSGRVLDAATNAPVAGASVFIDFPERETTSDARGAYRLAAIPVGTGNLVRIRVDGYADALRLVRLTEPRDRRLDLFLERGTPITVEVVDRETGRPLAGVQVYRDDGGDPYATTDVEGRFPVRVVEGMEPLRLRVIADGFCPVSWSWDARDLESVSIVRIPMLRLAWIEGRITDEEGNALGGVWAQASFDRARGPRELPIAADEKRAFGLSGGAVYELPEESEAESDERGRFELAVIPAPTPYLVSVEDDERGVAHAGPVAVSLPSSRAWVDLVLAEGATIRGRIRRNGELLGSGFVRWKSPEAGAGWEWVVHDGTYELRHVPAGRVRIRVMNEFGSLLAETELVVELGATHEKDFELTRGATISGRVLSSSGEPLGGVFVSAGERALVWTSSRGEYSLEVDSDARYDVKAHNHLVECVKNDVLSGTTDVDFVFPDFGKLRLKLLDAETRDPVQIHFPSIRNVSWRRSGENAYRPVFNAVDLDGNLELEVPLGPADILLGFQRDGYVAVELPGLEVTVEDPMPVIVELTRGSRVTLRVHADPGFDRERRGEHLFFLLEESQLDLIDGPHPEGDDRGDFWIDSFHMRIAHEGVLDQRLRFDDAGVAVLHGLRPGTYHLRSFPDAWTFDPPWFDVPEAASVVQDVRAVRR